MQATTRALPSLLAPSPVGPLRKNHARNVVAAAGQTMQGLLALPARAMLPAPPLRPSSLGLPQQRRARHQQQHAARPQRQQQQRLQPAAALPEALAALEASPVRDVAAAAFAVAGSVALIKFFDTLERHNMIDKKLSRKLVHTLAGPGFIACWPLFGAEPYSRLVAACVPALNGLRLLLIGSGAVKDERAVSAMSRTGDPAELLRGPLYYVIVLIAITALYWRDSPVGLTIASLMCGGDGLADIVGRRLGSGNPLPWNPEKSWAGSAAMFFGGLTMSFGLISLFCSLGYLDCSMPATLAAVAVIALAATVVESLPANRVVDDNLSVPGVAAFLGVLFLQVAVEVL
ncbi:hypothetical protein ABPG77_001974 [Micractinium sp. CCAP 211/92]